MPLTNEEMIAYYKKKGIDYSKTKNGNPNMKNKQNKETYKLLSKQECIICTNEMKEKGIAILECGHSFCISCTIQHFRIKNNCPLCRKVVCESINTSTKNVDEINVVIEDILNSEYDTRHNLTMHEYILEKLKQINSQNIHYIAYDILTEIKLSCLDIGVSI